MVIRSVGLALSLPLLASLAMAQDDEHVVTNIVNGLVYVSLGTRDGAAIGNEIEVIAPNGAVVGVLVLSGCGEVTCKAPLKTELAGKIVRGERVRIRPAIAEVPSATAAALPSASVSPPEPEEEEPVEPPAVHAPPPKPFVVPTAPPPELAATPRPWKDGDPAPPGYRVVRHTNSTMTRWGWITFSVAYGIAAIGAIGDSKDGSILLLPVAGPWVYMASTKTSYSHLGDGTTALIGIGEGVGLLLLIFGYSGKHVLVPTTPGLMVTPVVGPGTYGAVAVGRF
ncbi:MAG: hypothetical protein ACXWP4_00890 [Polyangiales bacterium]